MDIKEIDRQHRKSLIFLGLAVLLYAALSAYNFSTHHPRAGALAAALGVISLGMLGLFHFLHKKLKRTLLEAEKLYNDFVIEAKSINEEK